MAAGAVVRQIGGDHEAGVDDQGERGLIRKVQNKCVIVRLGGELDVFENAPLDFREPDNSAQVPFSFGPGLGLTGLLSGFGGFHKLSSWY